jgi:hypothetical protein
VCSGTAQLQLSPGDYTYGVERGPEYRSSSGKFKVPSNELVKVSVQLERIADLAMEGWWSGELHVHRPIAEMEQLMRAEDLHLAPVITWPLGNQLHNSQNLTEPVMWARPAVFVVYRSRTEPTPHMP